MSKQELSKSTVDESEAVSTDVVEEINESQSDQSAPEGTEKQMLKINPKTQSQLSIPRTTSNYTV